MTNYIVTKDNKILSLTELRSKIPATLFFSSLHDQVCLNIAKRKIHDVDSDEFKLYVNLLILKSKKVKELTALIFLINKKMLDIKEIRCSYVEKDFFDDFIDVKNNIKYVINFKTYNMIDTKYKYIIFPAKIIWHKFYRLLKSKFEYKKSLIKTFVEDTIGFYPDQMQNSTIFIYPFNLNVSRQKKFIQYCKKNHQNNYSLMGYPYSLLSYLYGLVTKDSDINIINTEKTAFFKHSIELLKLNIKELYTLDEFETSSFIMNKNLIKNNVFVLNKTHGVGGYCMYLNYCKLEVFTYKQYERYRQYNSNIEIVFQKLNAYPNINRENKNIKLVFMHGNMKACGLDYEEELEEKIIMRLWKLSLDLKVDFFIKFHPNIINKDKLKYIDLGIKELFNIEEIENPLFFTIFSTSFYDFLKFGPFIFLSDDFLDPTYIFGKDIIKYCNYKEAEEVVKYNIIYDNYKALHKKQIENLNNRQYEK